MKTILCTALLIGLTACHPYGEPALTDSMAKAQTNCRDWKYQPGTKAYNDCVQNMSQVHHQ